jgi:FdrA protein
VSADHVEARPGAYADSVTLMQVSADARKADGVEAALIAMATELNLSLLAGLGFQPPPQAGPNDLLIAVRARDEAGLAAALAAVDAALTARPVTADGSAAAPPPRTTAAAARAAGPGLALVSVPGRYAFAEAMDALDAGCDVMIFSDNMPVEQEVGLKDIAAQRGLLVMGPDCGTAIVGGVGLGFAHTLAPGPAGLVAASGTGAQQVLCLLDAAGVGVSAALGVGGRDLSAAVGGRSARAALAALDDDPATGFIIVVSKPPAPEVAAGLRGYAAQLATPVHFAFAAPGEPDLTAATETALSAMGMPVPAWPHWPGAGSTPRARAQRAGALRGLFAGGTLCDEAMVIASERLGVIHSNIPLRPQWRLHPYAPSRGHTMIDFGDDELTAGRAHPMIDQSLRLERLTAAAADPATSVILLDVVLGHGAHPDPAAELGPAIAAARARGGVTVAVSLIGAARDPQDLPRQAQVLQAAGAHVFASNAEATRFACAASVGTP